MKLIALSGPLGGQTITINQDKTIIGREVGDLRVGSFTVSREHCVIRRHGARYLIADRGSQNGTFVNEDVIQDEVELKSGDTIEVGDSIFRCVFDDQDALPPNVVVYDDTRMVKRALRMASDRTLTITMDDPRVGRNLSTLLDVMASLGSVSRKPLQELRAFKEQLLMSIAAVIPADYGVFLQFDTDKKQIDSVAWRSPSHFTTVVHPNPEIVEKVKNNSIAVLAEGMVEKSSSDGASRARSIVCSPLLAGERLLAMLYFAAINSEFRDVHLHLIQTLSSIAALPFESAVRMAALQEANVVLAQQGEKRLLYESDPMKKITDIIAKVADSNARVLIAGETGTGKELAAKEIHKRSRRSDKPFVAINCTALPESLLESELFGHVKGAFTGADRNRKGKLREAHGGTVFLDEIADMPLSLQPKLLRVLQEGEFVPLGADESEKVRVDIRWLCASHKDLKSEVANGRFREDLFYRLSGIQLLMPPLRNRPSDIDFLADYFAEKSGKEAGKPALHISPDAKRLLKAYPWPGNVRQLESVIQIAAIFALGEIVPEDLPEELRQAVISTTDSDSGTLYDREILRAKREIVIKALTLHSGKIGEAGKYLGINHSSNMTREMKLLGVKVENTSPLKIVVETPQKKGLAEEKS